MAVGAVGFWLPDTLWHAIRRSNVDFSDFIALSALLPLTLLGTYFLAKKRFGDGASVGAPLMVGVWCLGGIFIMVGASFSGGGILGPDGFHGAVLVLICSFIPGIIIELATYDGSLYALFVASIASVIIGAVVARKRSHRSG
jgi:hypothetical protein